jgi:hypothetical protein
MVRPETRSMLASLLTALLVVGLTNYFYWQPQLDLIRETKPRNFRISVVSTAGWTVVDKTTACLVTHADSVFRFNVTNVSNSPILFLRVTFEASNWNGMKTWSSDINGVLGPGDSIPVQHVWSQSEIETGHQAKFLVSAISASVPSETSAFCVTYS